MRKTLASVPIASELGESDCDPETHSVTSKPKAKHHPGATGGVRITKNSVSVCVCPCLDDWEHENKVMKSNTHLAPKTEMLAF